MRNTRRVADGEARTGGPEVPRPLRSAAPEWAGPLGSSGAAPDEPAPPATVDAPATVETSAAADTPATKVEPVAPAAERVVPDKAPAPEQREPESEWARPRPGSESQPRPAGEIHPRPGEEKSEAPPTAPQLAPAAGTPGTPTTDRPTVTVAAAGPVVPERAAGSRRRVRFAHALRRVPRARDVARGVRTWSARPGGRVALPAVLLLVLVVAGAAAGAIAIPMTASSRQAEPSGAATPSPTAEVPGGLAPLPTTAAPGLGGATPSPGATPTATTAPPATGRPADVLAAWANQTGAKLDIPWVAMQAYGYAELVIQRTRPNCNLKWTTLAAIGKVESNHGRHNATLGDDGSSSPRILGAVLDGTGGTQRILDTDDGTLDGDRTYDRAVGAMQFLPSTWKQHEVDADNDGLKDINDIDDAALAAGNYLCQGGRNLDVAQDWWNAILSYNDVRRYAQDVFTAANDYGSRSRT